MRGAAGGLVLAASLRPRRASAPSKPWPVIEPKPGPDGCVHVGVRKPLPRGTPVIEYEHDYNDRLRAAVVVWSGYPSPEDGAPGNPIFPLLIQLGPDEGGRVVETDSCQLLVTGFRARFFNVRPPERSWEW